MTAIASPEFVSPEFVSLCRTQLRLLTQQLVESAAALYITDMAASGDEQSNFIPVASYPEPVEIWVANFERATPWTNPGRSRALPSGTEKASANSEAATTQTPKTTQTTQTPEKAAFTSASDAEYKPESLFNSTDHITDHLEDPSDGDRPTDEPAFSWPEVLHPDQQLVMPLVYTDVVVGLLVAVRPDRAWQISERRYIETVAQSLAGGCVLERRNQWLQNQLAQKSGLQSRQSEVFHNLLHQFRNPLTAVSTFGQLLVKRLEPEDPNQSIATGIVRENKRLRELVSYFDEAVALGDADSTSTTNQDDSLPRLLPGQPLLLAGPSETDPKTGAGTGLGHPLTLSAQYLPNIIEPVLAIADLVSAEKGVALYRQVASDTPLVWGEEEALGEVVSNLVDNAIKYSARKDFSEKDSSEKGSSEKDSSQSAEQKFDQAQVWVQTGVSRMGKAGHYQGIVIGDTGPGIPVGDRARLFERNYRGVQATGKIPGTGLGLAIAQALVHEMQGFIEVISPAVGTPWIPNAVASDSHHNRVQANSNQTSPGTVFIVWLLEVEHTSS